MYDPIEPTLFSNFIMGNFTYEVDFGNFKAENSPFIGIKKQYRISNFTYIQLDCASKSVVNIVDN